MGVLFVAKPWWTFIWGMLVYYLVTTQPELNKKAVTYMNLINLKFVAIASILKGVILFSEKSGLFSSYTPDFLYNYEVIFCNMHFSDILGNYNVRISFAGIAC